MTKQLKSKAKTVLVSFCMLISLSAFSQKKVISINSTIQVKASKIEVFNLIKDLDRYAEWSPFLVTDPNQKNSVTGTSGQIGSVFNWEGVDEKSKGFQTLVGLENYEYIKFDCTIQKPFKGKPVFEYHIKEVDGQIEIIQNFNLRLSSFSFFMTKLFGVKKKMIATNQLGLERLKNLLEKETTINTNN